MIHECHILQRAQHSVRNRSLSLSPSTRLIVTKGMERPASSLPFTKIDPTRNRIIACILHGQRESRLRRYLSCWMMPDLSFGMRIPLAATGRRGCGMMTQAVAEIS
jgi:hypothetical protein